MKRIGGGELLIERGASDTGEVCFFCVFVSFSLD